MSQRITRSQTGATPRKPANPGYVETPGRQKRTTRRSAALSAEAESGEEEATPEPTSNGTSTSLDHVNGAAQGYTSTNGTNGAAEKPAEKYETGKKVVVDPTQLQNDHKEFGGSLGTGAMMIGFPLLMYYMWAGATYYDGAFPLPADGQSIADFFKQLASLCYDGAFPHARAWTIYWTFLVIQVVFYLFMPGVYAKGQALPHLGGRQLDYYCSAVWSFYANIVLGLALHYTGHFKLYTLIDEFGPIMSVAIITGFMFSIYFYISAHVRGVTTRMTGSPVYDFFMGSELNPRLFGWLDFKMFFEVRIPWYMLFFISLGTAARQYEKYGYVSGEVAFLVMAHWLYANACSKGEHLIVPTWDMYFEKLGFMLTFWNLAGVPLTYCHCTIYLANHHPSEYEHPKWVVALLFVAYLFFYWIWDTTNSQKNHFRHTERGNGKVRKTFPQLPWQYVENPKTIQTKTGKNLLCDGWYGLARKIHYTCDFWFALNWGLITGFRSPFPWFYPVFFTLMIIHRARRDIERCRKQYGEAWEEYERRVPYLFLPYVI